MTAIHDTTYPRLKPNPDEQELKQNFLPIKAELELLNKSNSEKSPHSRLGFMLSLKCYQCLGYHFPINTIPKMKKPSVTNIREFTDNLDQGADNHWNEKIL